MEFIVFNNQLGIPRSKLYILRQYLQVCFINDLVIHLFLHYNLFLALLLRPWIPFLLVLFVLKLKRHVLLFQTVIVLLLLCLILVHCNLWGLHKYPTSYGSFYVLTSVDDYSCVVWVYLLFEKSEVSKFFEHFYSLTQTQFEKSIKSVCFDDDTEFLGLKSFFLNRDISSNFPCFYSSTKWSSWTKTPSNLEYCSCPSFTRFHTNLFLGRMCANCCVLYKPYTYKIIKW